MVAATFRIPTPSLDRNVNIEFAHRESAIAECPRIISHIREPYRSHMVDIGLPQLVA